jgi:hypothetical protein
MGLPENKLCSEAPALDISKKLIIRCDRESRAEYGGDQRMPRRMMPRMQVQLRGSSPIPCMQGRHSELLKLHSRTKQL